RQARDVAPREPVRAALWALTTETVAAGAPGTEGPGASRTPRPKGGGEADRHAGARFDGDADEARRPAGPPARPASAQRQPTPQRGG
ncbi:hypothetical protein HMPREF0972_00058, partial [Actinomyces sp. oral taxon 848 str. F0332]